MRMRVYTLLAIITVAIGLLLSALFFWGVGHLIISVFEIPYAWSFMKGLCVAVIVWLIGCIFKK